MTRALAIVGPTAAGKTTLAIEVARRLDGEVVSLDSRQAYRGFRIGTAAPTAEELGAVPHHGVGFLEPHERYGAGRFARLATEWIAAIEGRGRVPILAGGTGLFLRALARPVFREPPMDPGRRAALREWLEGRPGERVRRWATRLDPALAERLDALDRQRAARTLELALLAGRPLSWWIRHGEPERPPLPVLSFVLRSPPEVLRERIERRARHLLEEGWVEEARALAAAGLEEAPPFDAVGYRDALALARGEIGREEAVERIVRATWAYARRQRTWFRHQVPEPAVRLDASGPTGQLARRIEREWSATAERPAERGTGGEGRRPGG